AADIADKDFRAGGKAAIEEGDDAAGESGVVEQVSDEDGFGVGRRAVEEIGGERGYGDGVEGGVEGEGGEGVGVGIGSGDAGRAGKRGGDGEKARAGAEVEDGFAGDETGMGMEMA